MKLTIPILICVICLVLSSCETRTGVYYVEQGGLYISIDFLDEPSMEMLRFGRDKDDLSDSIIIRSNRAADQTLIFFLEKGESNEIYVLDELDQIVYASENNFKFIILREYQDNTCYGWMNPMLKNSDNILIKLAPAFSGFLVSENGGNVCNVNARKISRGLEWHKLINHSDDSNNLRDIYSRLDEQQIEIPKVSDIDGMKYQTYQKFDMSTLKGINQAVQTPYVLVRESNDSIIVRLSDDIAHPYVITRHKDYYHCKWISNARGDSIRVDRFIKDKVVYQYIQRKLPDDSVSRRFVVHDYNKFEPKPRILFEYEFGLGKHKTLDENPAESFYDILSQKDRFFPSDTVQYINDMKYSACNVFCKQSTQFIYCRNRPESGQAEGSRHYRLSPMGYYDDHMDCKRYEFIKIIK